MVVYKVLKRIGQSTLSFQYLKGISRIKSEMNSQNVPRRLWSVNEIKKSLQITLQDKAGSHDIPEIIKIKGATQALLHFSWREIVNLMSYIRNT